MDAMKLDAFVYPTWSNPPRLIGDLNTPHGDNSQFFSPTTGFPAINVPMGYTRGTLPAGMTFFGRAWDEATLIRLAYAYEQATHHRHPPPDEVGGRALESPRVRGAGRLRFSGRAATKAKELSGRGRRRRHDLDPAVPGDMTSRRLGLRAALRQADAEQRAPTRIASQVAHQQHQQRPRRPPTRRSEVRVDAARA